MAFTSVNAIVLIQLLALVIGSSSKLSFGEVTENSSLYNHQDNKIISTKVRFSLGRFPKKSPSTPTPVKRPSPSSSPPPSPPPPSPPPPAQSPPLPAQSPPPPASPPPTKSPPPPPPPPPPAQSPKQTPSPSPTAQPPANQPAPPPSQPPKLPPPLSPPATQLPIGRPPQPSPPAQLPIRRPPPSPPATQLPIRRTPPQSPPTNQPPNNSSPPPPTDYDEPPPISHEPPFVEPPPTSQPPIIPFPPTLSPPLIPRITPPVKLPPPTIHPAGKPLIVVGRVNCKSCSSRVLPSLFKASPLHRASVKLVCHNNGRKANVQTALTDNNGDFSIIPISLARGDVHKCRVYLVKSPKLICSVPTNYNNGKSGAVLKSILPPGNHGPGPGPVFDFFGDGPFIFEAPNKFPCRK